MKKEVNIKRLGMNGEGIGYYDKKPIFIFGALPNETVLVDDIKQEKNFYRGTLSNITQVSDQRIMPLCPYFDRCGGCDIQHMNYEAGLEFKRDHLIQSLQKYMDQKFDTRRVKETIASPKPFHYRNKAQLPIRAYKEGLMFGLFKRGTNQLLPITHCPVQDDVLNKIFTSIVRLAKELNIPGFDERSKKGILKGAMVRVGKETNEVQVVLVTTKKFDLMPLIHGLLQKHPNIVSFFQTIDQDAQTQTYFNDSTYLIRGKKTIQARLSKVQFELGPEAFFQLNGEVAELFYETMIQLAAPEKHHIVMDAFAGTATLSHIIAPRVKKVIAVEIDPVSAKNAVSSLEKNHIENVKVIQEDFFTVLKKLKYKIDIMVFDPPRVGLGDHAIREVLKMKPKTIVYGSCNPSTLAKDLNQLKKLYDIVEIIPFDMFPQTAQVESVTLLSLKTS